MSVLTYIFDREETVDRYAATRLIPTLRTPAGEIIDGKALRASAVDELKRSGVAGGGVDDFASRDLLQQLDRISGELLSDPRPRFVRIVGVEAHVGGPMRFDYAGSGVMGEHGDSQPEEPQFHVPMPAEDAAGEKSKNKEAA